MKNKELKIGVFVISVLVISFFTINYLRGKDLFNREIELKARYSSVDGLVPSAPVYIKGYKAGKVSQVNYISETSDFEVICSVSKEFMIPEDSQMYIYGVDIMGSKGIRIELGQSDIMARNGSVLNSLSEAAMMDNLASSVVPLMDKVTCAIDSLNVTISAVNRILSDSNINSIEKTLSHLERTMSSVNSISETIDGRSAELDSFISNLSVLSDRFISIAEKADSTMSNVATISSSLSESDINLMVDSLNELLGNINDPDGTVGKLLTDDSVYKSVDQVLNDIDKILLEIKGNPKKYLKISVF